MSWNPFSATVENDEDAINQGQKLDPDEIRRRRLAKVGTVASLGNDSSNEQQTKRERTSYSPQNYSQSFKNDLIESSTSTTSSGLLSPQKDRIDNIVSSLSNSPQKVVKTDTTMTSSKKIVNSIDINSRTTNRALEEIFLMSLRQDCESSLKYLGMIGQQDGLLNSSNISEYICTRLISDVEPGGAVGYLGGCFRRLCLKETTATEKIRDELLNCRKQIVSFIVTALTEDGAQMFGPNAESSDEDLLRLLTSGDGATVNNSNVLLKELVDELSNQEQLEGVVLRFAKKCFETMAPSTSAPMPLPPLMSMQMMPPQQSRSIVDELPPSFLALLMFCQADKRVAKAIIRFPHLMLDSARVTARPPNTMQAQMMFGNSAVERAGVAGAAWEHHTLVGKILSLAPNPEHPAVFALMKDAHHQTKAALDNKMSTLRKNTTLVQSQVEALLMSFLKAGGEAKDLALSILTQCLVVNIEAGKDRPSPFVASSRPMLVNFSAVCLRLCRPILRDTSKIGKVDWAYFTDSEASSWTVFPSTETKLVTAEQTASEPTSGKKLKELNFITQSFFICWRALHLGLVPECLHFRNILQGLSRFHHDLRNDGREAVIYLVHKLCGDALLLAPELLGDVAAFCSAACTSLYSTLCINLPMAVLGEQSWLASADSLSVDARDILRAIPEHLVGDILELLLFVSKTDPTQFHTCKMEDTLSLVLFFLRRPWAMTSPHMRARLGEVLFSVFLPFTDERGREFFVNPIPSPAAIGGPQTRLLDSHFEAQRFLAPALLLLYGDVEKTGFYDKLSHRRSIMVCLKHLWTLPTHRNAFRGIAGNTKTGNDEGDAGYFIRFANGLMNETNALVASTMEKLVEIRQTQVLMQNAQEWGSLPSESRDEISGRLEGNEREVRFTAELCFETLQMFVYLTSDEVIRVPFLMPEILPRFTSMLLSVLLKLSGPKALEIKVDNMESYNFRPKEMLKEVCSAVFHFASFESFWRAIAEDGFYQDGTPLRKAVAIVKKLNLLSPSQVQSMEQLLDRVKEARESFEDMDALTADAPQEFLDPLMSTLMRCPVTLPTSGNVMDKAVISQHLLNTETDPFNRAPLTLGMCVPDDALRLRIDAWIESKRAERQRAAEMDIQESSVVLSQEGRGVEM